MAGWTPRVVRGDKAPDDDTPSLLGTTHLSIARTGEATWSSAVQDIRARQLALNNGNALGIDNDNRKSFHVIFEKYLRAYANSDFLNAQAAGVGLQLNAMRKYALLEEIADSIIDHTKNFLAPEGVTFDTILEDAVNKWNNYIGEIYSEHGVAVMLDRLDRNGALSSPHQRLVDEIHSKCPGAQACGEGHLR